MLVNLSDLKIIEKVPSGFGNGTHILLSKEHIGERVKIIIGNSKIVKKQLELDFFKSEILERKVKKFGTGAHVIIPKKYFGKKIKIIILGER